ncbi:MAG: hypothetical protein OXH52_03670 [Gammaproteobacteria bacterium]|nr:hypothetical protein [Gammaproteobacteria bacterium]
MAELMDRRPVFTMVLGCNGAGKSAWKRNNYDRLPARYFDQDSIAGGIGDWNDEGARARTREYVDGEVEKCFREKLDFGYESTFSGRPGPALLERAKAAGYRVEGYFLGTDNWRVNARRIEHRVVTNTGHYVDPARLENRYGYSLSNLRRHLEAFDRLEAMDNSWPQPEGIPAPRMQFVAEKGEIVERATELVPWAEELLRRREVARRQEEIRERRRKRGRGDCLGR